MSQKGLRECMNVVSSIIESEDYDGKHELFTKVEGDNSHVILRRFGDWKSVVLLSYDDAGGELQTIHLNEKELRFYHAALGANWNES